MRPNIHLSTILTAASAMPGIGITFIEGSDTEHFLSYEELYRAARAVLKGLQEKGLQPGNELVLQVEDNQAFVIVFWACILGGIIPVPLSVGQQDEHKKKLFNVWPVLNTPYLVIAETGIARLAAFSEEGYAGMAHRIITLDFLLAVKGTGRLYDGKPDDIAFIQFSSGSTGMPKGVMLTHRNLFCNMQAISKAADYSPSDSTLSWMPLTHDMGLIGFHLNPMFSCMQQYLMPVNLFVRRPVLWIDKACEHNVSILCSPNFGYEYFLRHLKDTRHNWDLSAVRLIYNGAEPVSEKLCRRFTEQLSSFGLSHRAMCPVYGLAEASLAVSISRMHDTVQWLELDRAHLNAGDRIVIGNGNTAAFVNVGYPVDNCMLRIVDANGLAAGEGIVGHIQIKGENVTAGYYNNPDETEQVTTTDGWLKTGDMGVIQTGALYVTGRYKDLVFVNGKNYYSHDLEQAALEIPGIELNKIVITGCFDAALQEEQALAFVFHRGDKNSFSPLAEALKAFISRRFELELNRIIPVKDIPRTTSGKLRRFRLVELYQTGFFDELIYEQFASEGRESVAVPVTAQEQKLLLLCREATGMQHLGIDEDFFEAGGNSLKAAEACMHIWKEWEIELTPDVFYTSRTIRSLAKEIGGKAPHLYEPLPVCGLQDCYPVSALQKGLYYHWELNRNAITYNIPEAFHIKGILDIPLLESCIRKLIARHDTLRTTFYLQNREPVFKVHEQLEFKLEQVFCTDGTQEEQLRNMVQPFDLSALPLFHIRLLSLDSNEHLLFTDLHHIISDGISVYHFINELLALYKGDALPALPVQYKDYVCWEKSNLQSAAMEQQKAFWLNRLQGELPVLDMPLDFQRPPVFTGEGEKLAFTLDQETIKGIRQFANENNCTSHTVLLAVYNLLLAIYTGQDDIILGIPVAGRRHPDLGAMQGMFVNNLVIRSAVREDITFRQLLQATADNVMAAMNNQDYPFDHLVRDLRIKRDISRNPLFDSMFIYQNMGIPAYTGSEFTFSRHFFNPGFAKFDVSVEIFDNGHSIQYYLEYATKLFHTETAARLARHFECLLRIVLEQPDVSRIALPALPDAMLSLSTTGNFPEKTIHQLFEEQVVLTPGHIALEYEGTFITYQQLNSKANALAVMLRKKGMQPGSIAATLLPRSPELIIAILAVLKAGGCYLPVDTDLPPERMLLLIAESKCSLVLAKNSTLALLPEVPLAAEIINIEHLSLPESDMPDLQHSSGPDDIAYIIYTSGTTGMPKGVVVEHRSLVNYITWACKQYIRGEVCTFPLFTSISFDLTVTSIFAPLVTGNRMIIYPDDEKELLISKVVADNRSQVVKLTPSHLKVLLELNLPESNSIRRFIVGGEAFPAQLAAAIHSKFRNVEIYNEYGPTEGTVGCMIFQFNPLSDQAEVPIGLPIDNTRIYLLDKGLKPVPRGVKGEIFISGLGVAREYWRNEMLTAQQFLPDPFVPGQRMYKTGDLARYLPGGDIAYIGRTDKQVKINGYRIEITEIEHWLSGYDNVTAAIVTARNLPTGQKCLYAYYTSDTGADLDETSCRKYLAARLPYYMIPAQFIRMDHIPLTRNGKVDVTALPDIPAAKYTAGKKMSYGYTGELLVKIWEEVLGEKGVTVTDNFFELGGDSVKAVQISSRMRDKGLSLSSRDILVYHTIDQLSLRVTAAENENRYEQGVLTGERDLLPIEAWFFAQNFFAPGFYNQSVLLNLHRDVDILLLEKAFQRIIEQHDGLRINYDPINRKVFYNGQHLQERFVVPVCTAATEEALQNICEDAKAGFDLQKSLLIKAVLIKGPAGDKLFITAHHLVIDGVSWRILLDDLYNVLENDALPAGRQKTAAAEDYQKILTDRAETWHTRSVSAYWNKLGNMGPAIPRDFETDDWRTVNLIRIHGRLEKEDTGLLLKHVAGNGEAAMPALINTALALALQKWTGGSEYLIVQEHHGRDMEGVDLSLTIGWFTNMYPAKITLADAPLKEQLKEIQEQLRGIPQQGISYGLYNMQGLLSPVRRLPDCRLNYLGQFSRELDNELFSFSGLATGRDTAPENNITAALDINVMVVNKELRLTLDYNKKAFLESTMQEVMNNMLRSFAAIIESLKGKEPAYRIAGFDTVDLNDDELSEIFC